MAERETNVPEVAINAFGVAVLKPILPILATMSPDAFARHAWSLLNQLETGESFQDNEALSAVHEVLGRDDLGVKLSILGSSVYGLASRARDAEFGERVQQVMKLLDVSRRVPSLRRIIELSN